jgi:hypothetical protein
LKKTLLPTASKIVAESDGGLATVAQISDTRVPQYNTASVTSSADSRFAGSCSPASAEALREMKAREKTAAVAVGALGTDVESRVGATSGLASGRLRWCA